MTDTQHEAAFKRCGKCGEVKPLGDFHRNNSKKNGFQSNCKECQCDINRAWRAANPEKARVDNSDRGRKWRAANRERHLENKRVWREAHPEEISAANRAWHEANGARKNADKRAQRAANPEMVRAAQRAQRAANPEPQCASHRAWHSANPDKIKEYRHRYRALKAGNGGSYTRAEMQALIEAQNGHCAYCNRTGHALHIDHIIPIAQGGPSWIWNLCLACRKCNCSKGNRTPEQWVNRWYERETS